MTAVKNAIVKAAFELQSLGVINNGSKLNQGFFTSSY